MSPAKTRAVLRQPEPGTIVNPVHTYTEEQTKMIQSLKEVSLSPQPFYPKSLLTSGSVYDKYHPPIVRCLSSLGEAMAIPA
jgi:hypothetical protein